MSKKIRKLTKFIKGESTNQGNSESREHLEPSPPISIPTSYQSDLDSSSGNLTERHLLAEAHLTSQNTNEIFSDRERNAASNNNSRSKLLNAPFNPQNSSKNTNKHGSAITESTSTSMSLSTEGENAQHNGRPHFTERYDHLSTLSPRSPYLHDDSPVNKRGYSGYYSKKSPNIQNNNQGLDNIAEIAFATKYNVGSSSNINSSSFKTPELKQNGFYIINETPVSNNIINSPKANNMFYKSPNATSPNSVIMHAADYDRYPIVSSKQALLNQMRQNSKNAKTGSLGNRSSSFIETESVESTTALISKELNASPFGGYPTTFFPLSLEDKEDDDFIHNPDLEEEARLDRHRFREDFKNMSYRSFGGWLGLFILILGALALFVVLPALTFTGATNHHHHGILKLFSHGTKNGTTDNDYLTLYEYPILSAIRTQLVDPDTPKHALSRTSINGDKWKLVFSDEFNAEGRTFYDGDDQFWTAPDIHYDATHDLEWYSPDASITGNGTLKLRMDAFKTHNLYYRSGMLQSWNKLCFTQGILEISANLPNYGRITGLWPGLWTMGNLARPGYLASSEGLWPYSYDSCDAGITPNQSSPDGISYLPGQRLNICTCDDEDHPNQGVGRGAPELDIIEGEADTTLGVGIASQSMQVAPFDIWYIPDYEFIEIYNLTTTQMNTYCGGPFQQAVSAVSTLNVTWYQFGEDAGYYQKYSLEYLNDNDDGYVTWYVGDTPTYTIHAKALHPNGNIGWRRISKEPMSIIMNLGISNNWAYIDWQMIFFPVTFSIDYVRLYQPEDQISLTCDPEDYPTYDYIQDHLNVYSNPNLTSWEDAGYKFPQNILTGNCSSSKFSFSDTEDN